MRELLSQSLRNPVAAKLLHREFPSISDTSSYEWLADESGYISSVAALEVWKKFGIEDRMGYSIEGGHMHCMLPECQVPEVAAFLDKFLLGKEADTKVRHIDQIIRDKMLSHGITVEQFIPWAE